jgi:periplasmic protein TonB
VELLLLETKKRTNQKARFGVGVTSLVLHVVLIAGAVYATVAARPADTSVKVDTTVVLLSQEQKAPEQPKVQLVEPLKGFQTVVVPTVIPATVPPIDLQEKFDPKDYTGIGVEGGRADGITPPADAVYAEAVVEERPALLSAPPPPYPDILKQAGIQGRVLLSAIVDTTGRVEPNSIQIVKSPNPAFDLPARSWVLQALFRPARLHGQAVRVHVTLPIDYSIKRG